VEEEDEDEDEDGEDKDEEGGRGRRAERREFVLQLKTRMRVGNKMATDGNR